MEIKKFEELYDTYYNSVYKYIYVCVKDKWNAEDIISVVFIKVYENMTKLTSLEEAKHWIFRVAHNAVIDFYRKNAKVIPIDTFLEEGEEDKEFDNILIKDEFNSVKKFVEQLPEDTKKMIYLRFYGDLKFKDIAIVLDKPENTIKTTVSRALRKIKDSYERSKLESGEKCGGKK